MAIRIKYFSPWCELQALVPQETDSATGAMEYLPVLKLDSRRLRMAERFIILHSGGRLPASALAGFEAIGHRGTTGDGVEDEFLVIRQRNSSLTDKDRMMAEIYGLDRETMCAIIGKIRANVNPDAGPVFEDAVSGIEQAQHRANDCDDECGDLQSVHGMEATR